MIIVDRRNAGDRSADASAARAAKAAKGGTAETACTAHAAASTCSKSAVGAPGSGRGPASGRASTAQAPVTTIAAKSCSPNSNEPNAVGVVSASRNRPRVGQCACADCAARSCTANAAKAAEAQASGSAATAGSAGTAYTGKTSVAAHPPGAAGRSRTADTNATGAAQATEGSAAHEESGHAVSICARRRDCRAVDANDGRDCPASRCSADTSSPTTATRAAGATGAPCPAGASRETAISIDTPIAAGATKAANAAITQAAPATTATSAKAGGRLDENSVRGGTRRGERGAIVDQDRQGPSRSRAAGPADPAGAPRSGGAAGSAGSAALRIRSAGPASATGAAGAAKAAAAASTALACCIVRGSADRVDCRPVRTGRGDVGIIVDIEHRRDAGRIGTGAACAAGSAGRHPKGSSRTIGAVDAARTGAPRSACSTRVAPGPGAANAAVCGGVGRCPDHDQDTVVDRRDGAVVGDGGRGALCRSFDTIVTRVKRARVEQGDRVRWPADRRDEDAIGCGHAIEVVDDVLWGRRRNDVDDLGLGGRMRQSRNQKGRGESRTAPQRLRAMASGHIGRAAVCNIRHDYSPVCPRSDLGDLPKQQSLFFGICEPLLTNLVLVASEGTKGQQLLCPQWVESGH